MSRARISIFSEHPLFNIQALLINKNNLIKTMSLPHSSDYYVIVL